MPPKTLDLSFCPFLLLKVTEHTEISERNYPENQTEWAECLQRSLRPSAFPLVLVRIALDIGGGHTRVPSKPFPLLQHEVSSTAAAREMVLQGFIIFGFGGHTHWLLPDYQLSI